MDVLKCQGRIPTGCVLCDDIAEATFLAHLSSCTFNVKTNVKTMFSIAGQVQVEGSPVKVQLLDTAGQVKLSKLDLENIFF